MASRRDLKKTIRFVSSELISEVYFRCLMLKKIDEQKVETVVLSISSLNDEYIRRVNHPNGVDNPKLVKSYFRAMYADWQQDVEKIVKEMDALV